MLMPLAFPRLRLLLQCAGAAAVLAAVFCLGLWLTWPEFPYNPSGFPIGRKFVAVSLNGKSFNYERMPHLPTFEVKRSALLRLRSFGYGGCNAWSGDIELSSEQIVWKNVGVTALGCIAMAAEESYLKALLQTTRWRREEGTLILENDTDILRFKLAPRACTWPWCAPRLQLADR